MIIVWMIVVTVFFVFLQAFFSGSEMGVISVNRIKLEQLAQSKVRHALLLKQLLASPDRLLSTTLVGTNLSVVMSSATFTALIVTWLGQEYLWLTSLVITPVVLIFSEAVPKVVFRYYADKLTLRLSGALKVFSILFWPAVAVLTSISRFVLLPDKTKKTKAKSLFVSREELKMLIKESKKSEVLKPLEQALIHRIFEFGSKKAKEIAIPLKSVVNIDAQASLAQLKELSRQTNFTRILVYAGKKEDIIGFANVFDSLYEAEKFLKVLDCLRPVLYISEESPIDNVFYSMQLKRMQIAILLDEHNRHVGMVTLKDLLDEIVEE